VKSTTVKTLEETMVSVRSVTFAYLFGSQARGNVGKLSDVDIAVFLRAGVDPFSFRLKLAERIARALRVQKVDVLILSEAAPVLAHQVIKTGIVIKESRHDRIDFEMKTLQKYLDTEYLRSTQVLYVKEQLDSGTYFG